jgi:hypothetical protein
MDQRDRNRLTSQRGGGKRTNGLSGVYRLTLSVGLPGTSGSLRPRECRPCAGCAGGHRFRGVFLDKVHFIGL